MPNVSPRATSRLLNLPVTPYAAGAICAGEGFVDPVVLRWNGSEVIGTNGVGILPIRWPVGYQAVLDPDFTEVLTERGDVFLKAGGDITDPSLALRGYEICYQGRNGIDVFWALASGPP